MSIVAYTYRFVGVSAHLPSVLSLIFDQLVVVVDDILRKATRNHVPTGPIREFGVVFLLVLDLTVLAFLLCH